MNIWSATTLLCRWTVANPPLSSDAEIPFPPSPLSSPPQETCPPFLLIIHHFPPPHMQHRREIRPYKDVLTHSTIVMPTKNGESHSFDALDRRRLLQCTVLLCVVEQHTSLFLLLLFLLLMQHWKLRSLSTKMRMWANPLFAQKKRGIRKKTVQEVQLQPAKIRKAQTIERPGIRTVFLQSHAVDFFASPPSAEVTSSTTLSSACIIPSPVVKRRKHVWETRGGAES